MNRPPASAVMVRRAAWRIAALTGGAVLVAVATALAVGWAVYEAREGGGVFEPAADERREQALLAAGAVAGLVGAVVAVVGAWLVGRQALHPLGRALELQDRFVADAGHELRSPLTLLSTRAQLLRRRTAQGDAHDPRLADLDLLLEDTAAMTDVVDDLLLAARLEHAGAPTEPVDLRRMVRDLRRRYDVLGREAGVRIELPDGPSPVVAGSVTALTRAVCGLLDNAVAHSPQGGVVTVTVTEEGDRAAVTVVDDGEGFDPREARRLTERFARGAAPDVAGGRRRYGLGLALVDDVARAHGGRLALGQEPGRGASTRLLLPRSSEGP